METCLITTVTMTFAMKGKRILEANGISATVSRMPPNIAAAGCAWGCSIDCRYAQRAKQVLETADYHYERMVHPDGTSVLLDKGQRSTPPVGGTGVPRTTISGKEGGRRK